MSKKKKRKPVVNVYFEGKIYSADIIELDGMTVVAFKDEGGEYRMFNISPSVVKSALSGDAKEIRIVRV